MKQTLFPRTSPQTRRKRVGIKNHSEKKGKHRREKIRIKTVQEQKNRGCLLTALTATAIITAVAGVIYNNKIPTTMDEITTMFGADPTPQATQTISVPVPPKIKIPLNEIAVATDEEAPEIPFPPPTPKPVSQPEPESKPASPPNLDPENSREVSEEPEPIPEPPTPPKLKIQPPPHPQDSPGEDGGEAIQPPKKTSAKPVISRPPSKKDTPVKTTTKTTEGRAPAPTTPHTKTVPPTKPPESEPKQKQPKPKSIPEAPKANAQPAPETKSSVAQPDVGTFAEKKHVWATGGRINSKPNKWERALRYFEKTRSFSILELNGTTIEDGKGDFQNITSDNMYKRGMEIPKNKPIVMAYYTLKKGGEIYPLPIDENFNIDFTGAEKINEALIVGTHPGDFGVAVFQDGKIFHISSMHTGKPAFPTEKNLPKNDKGAQASQANKDNITTSTPSTKRPEIQFSRGYNNGTPKPDGTEKMLDYFTGEDGNSDSFRVQRMTDQIATDGKGHQVEITPSMYNKEIKAFVTLYKDGKTHLTKPVHIAADGKVKVDELVLQGIRDKTIKGKITIVHAKGNILRPIASQDFKHLVPANDIIPTPKKNAA